MIPMWQAIVEVSAICLLAMLLALSGGCSPVVKIDFTCFIRPNADSTVLQADCADEGSWKSYFEKQRKAMTEGDNL